MRQRQTGYVILTLAATFLGNSQLSAQEIGPEAILSYQPLHKAEVQIETPTGADIAKCEVKVEQEGKRSGYVLLGPQGQTLRRFMDTDGDGKVDEFRYYQYGLEVYRDLDSKGDNKVDQSRWMNTQGTRWGIDSNQDGKIDRWKIISAEEASREAILALVQRDPQRLLAVFIDEEDIKTLGLAAPIAKRFLENRAAVTQQFAEVLSSTKVVTPRSTWVRFDSSMLMPNLIPADSGKGSRDIFVYENVMAIVATGEETGFVQLGEMVRIGDTWKLTQMPKPIEGNEFDLGEGGLLLQPSVGGMPTTIAEGLSEEMRALLDQLRELDAKSPAADAKRDEIIRYNVARARMLGQIASISNTAEERELWLRQRLELIAAATQMETYPNGLEELQRTIVNLRKDTKATELLAFTVFQEMLVRYNFSLQRAKPEERADVQTAWLKSLEDFVTEFPKAPESADALLQLAITNEFNGDLKEARVGYTRLVSQYAETDAARRGQGALRRLGLVGQPLTLNGPSLSGRPVNLASYQGKVTLVIFWATWCKPCTEDLPQIQELYRTHQRDGFEIVGVNLDSPGSDIQGYLRDYRVTWPQIHEEGGLESRPAIDYGIISLPTMFLMDKTGRVVSNNVSVEDLKKTVPELVKK